MGDDWARPVVHWEIVARDPQRQAEFYRRLCTWEIGDGPIMDIGAGLGGPEPGPAGHIRKGDRPGVTLFIQVRDLSESLALVVELGGRVVAEPFDIPGGPTLAAVEDPEGVALRLGPAVKDRAGQGCCVFGRRRFYSSVTKRSVRTVDASTCTMNAPATRSLSQMAAQASASCSDRHRSMTTHSSPAPRADVRLRRPGCR